MGVQGGKDGVQLLVDLVCMRDAVTITRKGGG